jgi:hypothetical protein
MKVDLKILAQIILAVVMFGWGWISDNMIVVIGFIASVLVWLFDFLTKYKIILGKFWKTVAAFLVSLILQLLITHPTLPTFPGWDISLLVTYIGEWFALAQSVMLASMVIYSMLLEKVLANSPGFVKLLFVKFAKFAKVK